MVRFSFLFVLFIVCLSLVCMILRNFCFGVRFLFIFLLIVCFFILLMNLCIIGKVILVLSNVICILWRVFLMLFLVKCFLLVMFLSVLESLLDRFLNIFVFFCFFVCKLIFFFRKEELGEI